MSNSESPTGMYDTNLWNASSKITADDTKNI